MLCSVLLAHVGFCCSYTSMHILLSTGKHFHPNKTHNTYSTTSTLQRQTMRIFENCCGNLADEPISTLCTTEPQHTLGNPSSSWRCSVPATRPFRDSTTTSWAVFISCLDRILAFKGESVWIWLDQPSKAPQATTTNCYIHLQELAVTGTARMVLLGNTTQPSAREVRLGSHISSTVHSVQRLLPQSATGSNIHNR